MRSPNLRMPKILPKRLPLARCLIAFYVLVFLIFSSLLGLLAVPFPSPLPSAHKLRDINNNGGCDGRGRDVEWLMFRPNPVNQSTISVCVRLGGLAAVGGLESWFWTLQEYVLSSDKFRLHAVNLEALHYFDAPVDRFYYSRSAVARIVESTARLNIGPEEIIDECDIVLSSWVDPPLRPPSVGQPHFKSILIIHGSDAIEHEGTWMYAHQLNAYDATVCVSAGCMVAYGPAFQKQLTKTTKAAENFEVQLQYIPSSIDLAKYDRTADPTHARAEFNLPLGTGQKILGFLGRIAEDKNPQLFVDVVSKLPKNWIGAMAGPLYLPEQMVSNLTSRVHLLGDVQEPWKFLAAIDALYVPSKEEGGPIVLLEAWAMVKPFFMRRTGLAVDHEDGVFIIPDDATPEAIAQLIDEKINTESESEKKEVEKKINYGLKTVKDQFSTEVIRQKYHNLMENLLENNHNNHEQDNTDELELIQRLPFHIYYPKGEPPSQEALQLTRRGRTLWGRCFYKQCLFYVKINSFLANNSSSSRKVTIIVRTFSGNRSINSIAADGDGGVAGFLRPEKGTEKLATIEANTGRQSINLTLSTNIFGVQLFDGHAIQLLDVLTAT